MTDNHKERAKRALALFICEYQKIPFISAQDLIDHTESICHTVYLTKSFMGFHSIEEVIEEYLGLTDFYAELFYPEEN